jgi:hypothetical protein
MINGQDVVFITKDDRKHILVAIAKLCGYGSGDNIDWTRLLKLIPEESFTVLSTLHSLEQSDDSTE